MPSKSPAQARLMAASAHARGGFAGVPQSVGKEFNSADAGTGIIKASKKSIKNTSVPKMKKNTPAPMLGVYKKKM